MAGSIPPTGYLLTGRRWGGPQEFNTLLDIAYTLGIAVNDSGVVTFNGESVQPTYAMDEFTKEEVIKDWVRCYMHKNLPIGYKLYRYLL